MGRDFVDEIPSTASSSFGGPSDNRLGLCIGVVASVDCGALTGRAGDREKAKGRVQDDRDSILLGDFGSSGGICLGCGWLVCI